MRSPPWSVSPTELGRGRELGKRAALDLAHALAAQPEAAADLAQRLLRAVDAVARAQHLALAVGEARQQRVQLLALDRLEHALVGVLGERVGEQLAERPDVPVADGLLEGARGPFGRQQGVDLVGRQPGPRRELAARRLVAGRADGVAVGLLEP